MIQIETSMYRETYKNENEERTTKKKEKKEKVYMQTKGQMKKHYETDRQTNTQNRIKEEMCALCTNTQVHGKYISSRGNDHTHANRKQRGVND